MYSIVLAKQKLSLYILIAIYVIIMIPNEQNKIKVTLIILGQTKNVILKRKLHGTAMDQFLEYSYFRKYLF